MSAVELIGFIITMLALVFLFTRQAVEERKRRRDPEGYAKRMDEKAKMIERLLTGEVDDEEEEPMIKKVLNEPHELEEWEKVKEPTALPVVQKVAEPKQTDQSSALTMWESLEDKRSIAVFHAIFGPPKGL